MKPGDVIRLRRAHPCGSYEWGVIGVGDDIDLRCLKCQRRVLLTRDVSSRRVRRFVSKGVWPTSLVTIETPLRRDGVPSEIH